MTPKRRNWSYSTGRRKSASRPSSQVRVYERPDLDGLFMTCAWDKTSSGRPQEVKLPDWMSRDDAKSLAKLTSAKRELRLKEDAPLLGRRRGVELRELLEKYHRSADAREWSKKHRGDKERGRDFWLSVFDPEMDVLELNKAIVRRLAREARERADWGVRKERKLLAYIRAATRWGCEQAELYEVLPLRGLRMPRYEPDTDALFYSEDETRLLLQGHVDADWRDVLAANIVADTGRRITAVLHLRTSDILTDGEEVYLRFRGVFDKVGRTTSVPVSAETAELLAQALERPIVDEHGWLFPEGRLAYDDPVDKPRSKDAAIDGLHELEKLVGVESVPGRAYHGIKRAHVTASMELSGGDTSLVGDVTGNLSPELLRGVYRRGNRRRSRAQVEAVGQRLRGTESTRESTRKEGGPDGAA